MFKPREVFLFVASPAVMLLKNSFPSVPPTSSDLIATPLSLIVTFLAVLDLIRLGICYVVQNATFGELILIKVKEN